MDIVPSDALFETAFSEVRISQDFIARYLLRALEMKATGDAEPENIPNDEENVINVEHLLPEHPGNNWPGIDKDMASALYKRVGNMNPQYPASKDNLIDGNRTPGEKVRWVSAFLLTSEVAKETKWEAKQIKDRQARLAKLAVEARPA